ncbi:protein-tyrosine sulfotransferase-like isoform X2 [Silene latifolia]|uniref:protein-tyrosine sulfotransferase-like isoform X2 n=1 Tax=Silene latifolia TaxID=37657 RepID=UPI003D785513
MDSTPFLFLLLLLFTGSAFLLVNASSEDDFQLCESVVNKWATSQLNHEFKEDKHTLRDLLFFLHIPRTGGRTYFHCFLKKLYSTQLECPRSYDKLRFNPRKANCRLLVTHDDYSMMSKLPKEKTSVVTILRNPVDRVFSTYEFSIEVAARFLVHSNLTSITQLARRLRKKNNAVSTLDIWPWKYLVPWMREDLFARRDARLLKKQNHVGHNDSYEMGDMAMPLHQYINDPIALDIVHNGATFQIAGLTNNSYMAESHEVRACIRKHPALGDSVLDVAKRRLDHMLYVGLTEDHKESATAFAHVVGAQVISQLVGSNSSMGHLATNLTEQNSPLTEFDSENSLKNSQNGEIPSGRLSSDIAEDTNNEDTSNRMTVKKLMESYEVCISGLRKSQARRRVNSLSRISPVNFTKEARLQVPESVINQIIALNRLDMELYKYAQDIFSQQHTNTVQKLVQESEEIISVNSFASPPWKDILLVMAIVLVVLALCVCLNARRRTFKVKV